MNRRDFHRIALGVLGALGLRRRSPRRGRQDPDSAYLELGLTAMARADTWFPAHWGAAVLAGSYLCADNDLGPQAEDAIRAELDVLIERNPALFRRFPDEPAREESIQALALALEPTLGDGLREHGHAVIYTALATRALRDVPGMAVPAIVDGIRGHVAAIGRKRPQAPGPEMHGYADTQAMVEATFASLQRFTPLVGHQGVRRPNFTHQVTHTEALTRLETLGRPDLARRGFPAHQVHLNHAVPEVDARPALDRSQAGLAAILRPDYWTDRERQARWHAAWSLRENPNGDWIASGHLFKVLYAYCGLARRMPDDEVVESSALVLLERYFYPDVQGG